MAPSEISRAELEAEVKSGDGADGAVIAQLCESAHTYCISSVMVWFISKCMQFLPGNILITKNIKPEDFEIWFDI